MLLNLHVKNFALIDEIDIDFSKGLNILTGETGAGKSIVLGSLAIALGAKADKDCIRTGEEFALVEITFTADTEEVKNKLIENDISLENDCVLIQRKITPVRSVFKLNSQTVTISVIKDIASALIDIYGQHDYQNLLNSRKHIEILDSFAKDSADAVSGYKKTYAEYLRLKALAESPEVDEVRREREISLLEYQINEIKSAALKPNEDAEVEERLKVLENAYKIQSTLSLVKDMMYDYESSAGEMINKSIREMSAISSYDSALSDMFDELNNIYSLVSDFERETMGVLEDYAPNEEELVRLRERYNLINELERKYGRTIENVLEYLDDKEKELAALEDYAVKRESILKDYEKAKDALKKSADALTEVRKKTAKSFEKAITEGLSDLNFNQSSFNVAITEANDYTANGIDKVNFEISTNPGEPLKPLENVSSGGELSRIMLAIKTVGAKSDNTETLIFDEIDAGISGVTAWKVAKKLALLSKDHQIILITHLQQIAAMADVHFEIKKTVSDNSRTNTYIEVLDKDGEIKEIARMLGDDSGSDKFLDNASEIKKQALDYKKSIDI
ncbi:MAG: DNA repair protein RecN [Lachnospiraceae bacterium]|nr:DNA repair protein RecN [Lachnospiraceae bacterium]